MEFFEERLLQCRKEHEKAKRPRKRRAWERPIKGRGPTHQATAALPPGTDWGTSYKEAMLAPSLE